MKNLRTIIIFAAAAGLAGVAIQAQSNKGVPGPTDYADFSRFITDRNIFDPNRVPHSPGRPSTYTPPPVIPVSAPAFSLVGTMAYEKGYFAFFNGNQDGLKKVLHVPGEIAGYTVAQIQYGRVTLEATNPAQKIELTVGDVMRQENGAWRMTGPGDVTPVSSSDSSSRSNQSTGSAAASSSSSNAAPPPSAAEASDILKRLMEKRAQENQ